MKFKLFLISALLVSISLHAHGKHFTHEYVTFVIEDLDGTIEQLIHYPAGTTYKVYLTKKNAETISTESSAIYEGDLQLTVYPSYRKSSPELIELEGKRLRIYVTAKSAKAAGFGDMDSNPEAVVKVEAKKEKARASNYISAERILTSSLARPGKYNIKLLFSNGVVFTYLDGKYNATQNGEQIEIKGRYLLYAETGILKVSFDPYDGELWWVFENQG